MHEESLMYDEERKEDENQERQESIRNWNEASGKHRRINVSSVGTKEDWRWV